MHLYALTLQKASTINHAIHGNFSGSKQQEIVISRGKIIELLRPDPNTGKVFPLLAMEMFGVIRDLIAFRLTGGSKGKCIYHNFPEVHTVEPRFNEVLNITNKILCPGQSYRRMYGIIPQYSEPRYNKFFDITDIIRNPKCKTYLDITNYNVNMQQKINAEQINSQHIL